MDDTSGIEDWDKRCIVCEEATDHGAGVCQIKVIDMMTALCCPHCIETFNKEPQRYLGLRHINEANARTDISLQHDDHETPISP